MLEKILERIKCLREEKGFSQDYMAYRLSIGQSTYNKIENNQVRLDLDRLVAISQLLEVDLFLLLTGNIPPNYNSPFSEDYVLNLLEKIKIQESEIAFLREIINKKIG